MKLAQPPSDSSRPSGLSIYLMVIYSARRAFQLLADSPTWIPAASLSIALLAVVLWLWAWMSEQHAIASGTPYHHLPLPGGPVFLSVGLNILIWLYAALIFHVGARITGGETRFALAWTAAVNLSSVYIIGALVNLLLIATVGHAEPSEPINRHPAPSVESLVHAQGWLGRFLEHFTLPQLWLWLVSVISLEQTLKMRRGPAIATVITSTVLAGALLAIPK